MTHDAPISTTLRQLLTEAFRGSAGGSTWFLDEAGLLDTIRPLDASQASSAPVPGSATIAGHVEHVRWFVALMNAFARGERPQIAWEESWTVSTVDAAAWARLREEVEREYEELLGHFETEVDASIAERLMPQVAIVAHVAYHVGALRQMTRLV